MAIAAAHPKLISQCSGDAECSSGEGCLYEFDRVEYVGQCGPRDLWEEWQVIYVWKREVCTDETCCVATATYTNAYADYAACEGDAPATVDVVCLTDPGVCDHLEYCHLQYVECVTKSGTREIAGWYTLEENGNADCIV